MKPVSLRGGGATLAVSALSAAFGTVLIMVIADFAAYFAATGLDGIGQASLMLGVVAALFFGIALYVGAVVTANSVSTVIAGRTREIALLRLIGASGATLRGRILREGVLQGAVGALIGCAVGALLTAAAAQLAMATGVLDSFAYPFLHPAVAAPVLAVTAATAIAAWSGSRRVLAVSPMAATGSATEPRWDELRAGTARRVVSIGLVALGFLLLAGGVVLGLVTSLGVLLGLAGGMISFTGVVLGAPVFLPPLMRLLGRMLGRGPVPALAAANAVRNPARSSRAVVGLVIGVTLVTMFAVATETFRSITYQYGQMQPEYYAAFEQVISTTTAVMSVLLGFSVLLAAVGMINTLSLSVLQRRRELGLLRALGFTVAQVRRMIVAEATAMVASATLFGILLGVFYGWAGAQSTFGSLIQGVTAPSIPWPIMAAVVVATVAITIASSLVPARRATRVSPVAALAVD
ncbi:FtsX-like permease family protein [Microbacteriaceae bacterium VKM Ac-2854]|nr:FtsX-like permease family protein [Microbacteriaceae bacterium VKM Ac-2854]